MQYCLRLFLFMLVYVPSVHAGFLNDFNAGHHKDIAFRSISGLTLQGDTLVISEGSSGLIRHIHPEQAASGQVTTIPLAGKGLILKSKKIGGLVTLPNNNFAIVGRGDDVVIITDNKGKLLLRLGGSGSSEGQLDDPSDIAYSSQGRIYVAEQGNHRVSVFSPDGLFLFSMGQNGEKKDKRNLSQPIQIGVDAQHRVYVLEASQGGRLSVYSPTGVLIRQVQASALKEQFGGNVSLSAMEVRSDGRVFIADKRSGKIALLDWQQVKISKAFGTAGQGRGQFKDVRNMVYHAKSGRLYISDVGNKKIETWQVGKLAAAENHAADLFSVRKTSVLKSDCPISYILTEKQTLCLDPKLKAVSIRSQASYEKPDNTAAIDAWDVESAGWSAGKVLKLFNAKFSNPTRAVFNQQNILILDGKDIKVFDVNGDYQFSIGKKGSRIGEFNNPKGIALAADIYVADTGNRRVQVFSNNGVYLRSIGNSKDAEIKLQEPTSVTVDRNGRVYVADNTLAKVLIYSPQGRLLDQIGKDAKHPHQFKNIFDLMTDSQNRLYILAQTDLNHRGVWMYKNHKLMFRFSPSRKKAFFGFDSNWNTQFVTPANSNALDELIGSIQGSITSFTPPAIDPKKSNNFFNSGLFGGNGDGWIFNGIPANNTSIAVVDLGAKARHTFLLLDIPAQVSDLKVGGDTSSFILNWKKPNPQFIGTYHIFARSSENEPFQKLTQTTATHLKRERGGNAYTQYHITAVSGYGKQGHISRVYKDYFQIGYALYQQQDYRNSQQHFKHAIALNTNHPGAYEYLGRSLIADGAMDEAVVYFEALAAIPGYETNAYNLHAEALIQNKAWLKAKKVIDKAVAGQFANDLSYGLCAQSLLAVDDLLGSINCLEQAIKANPREIRWHLKQATAYAALDSMDQAKESMNKAVQLAKKDADHWVLVGKTYQALNLLDDALVCFNSALKIQPNHEKALFDLAQLHLQRKDLDQARQVAMTMASNPASSGMANYVLGRIALAQGQTGKALIRLDKATKQASHSPIVWQALADAYLANGDLHGVKKSLQTAVKVDPESFDLRLRLGGVCLSTEALTCATEHYQKAVYQQPNSYDAQLGLATSLLKQQQLSKAAEHANRANMLDTQKTAAIALIADIQIAQGNISEGIDTLKRALKLDNNNDLIHLQLAKAYFANQFYDMAQESLESAKILAPANPAPVALLGEILLARQMFDQAIVAFTQAGKLSSGNLQYRQRLNYALLQKKNMAALGGKNVGLTLGALKFEKVFSSAYKQYANTPIGTVSIQNNSGISFENVKLSLHVKTYMDFATTRTITAIQPHQTLEIPLFASFNNNILSIDENTGVQTEVKASYYAMGKSQETSLTQPITIYGKNAMLWSNMPMIGSFVTPKDELLNVFTRQGLNQHRHATGLLNKTLVKAMTIFELMSALDIKYIQDPNNPYSTLDSTQVDTVQFPRETLRLRSGDCDDLSVLLAAAFENLGIETALLDVPGHLLFMFNTGVPETSAHTISNNKNLLAIRNGQVWVPVEATLIAASFSEAWIEGGEKYTRYSAANELKAIALKDAWNTYTPVTLPPASFKLAIPRGKAIDVSMNQEWNRLAENAAGRAVLPFKQLLNTDPSNKLAKMQVAIIYARYGLFDQAINMMGAIIANNANDSSAYNNIGNIYYLNNDMTAALSSYQKAEVLEASNADIKVNIAMAYYKQGAIPQSSQKFSEAQKLDNGVNERYKQLKLLLNK